MSAAESDSVRVARSLTASPERAYNAWVDSRLLRCWLAPVAEADPHVGGRFRLEVSKAEGIHVVTGEYLELAPQRRIIMTWVYEGPIAPEGKVPTRVTVEFREDGPGTEIGVQHDHLTNANYRDVIRKGAWTNALDQLEAVLADATE